MDVITDIFRTLHVTAAVQARLEFTAPWALSRAAQEPEGTDAKGHRIAPSELAHFGMVARGNCWLTVDGIAEPIPLTGGDCFLLTPGSAYTLGDDPRTRARSFCEIGKPNGNVIQYGGGGAPTTIISGFLSFESITLKPLSQFLPSLILIKAEQARTLALHSTVQLLTSEMTEDAPGSEVVTTSLAEVLFVQAIRAHIATASDRCKQAWLRAIFDPQIGKALKAVHEDVKAPWTVESLAAAAGMSRSAFAQKFKELLEQTPLDYVTEWRMQKALPLLQRGDKKLVEVAQSVGYESDAAFSKAFKRVLGVPPREYRVSAATA